jgi:anoctamin-10
MAAALSVIISFLNMTGVIRPTANSIFDIPFLSSLADPGEIFDPEGYTNMLPSIA